MELEQYIRVVKRWLWLIIVAAFIGGGIGFITTTGRPTFYTASTTVAIGHYLQDANPTTAQIIIGQGLSDTYKELVTTRNILQGVVDQLNYQVDPEALRSLIATDILPNTSLLVISVRSLDPVLSQDIANALADQLIRQSPTNLTTEQQSQVDLANAQIQALTTQIEQQRATIQEIDTQITATTDQAELDRLTERRSQLVDQVNQATATIAQFQTTITALEQRTNALTIVERAGEALPSAPASTTTAVLAGALAGAVIAGVLGLVLEYFDDKVRTTEIAARMLGLPVLGAIPRFGTKKDAYNARLITNFQTLSPVVEAYRKLRTNLLFSSHDDDVFLITSSGPGEGKSVTSANLAAMMASAGMRVLLIDADLRRPKLHEIFGLDNQLGLTTLLFVDPSGNRKSDSEMDGRFATTLNECLQATSVANLKIITSGFIPSNPPEVLGSALMKRWIEAFRGSANVDKIIIDTPPALMFSDVSTLATLLKCGVVLVADSQRTRRAMIRQTVDQLRQAEVEIKGVIVNKINPRDEFGYYNTYYYDYYSQEAPPKRGFLGLGRKQPPPSGAN